MYKFYLFLFGLALCACGLLTAFTSDAFTGLLVMIWGAGIVTTLYVRGLQEQPRARSPATTKTMTPRTVQLHKRRILIDGKPSLVFSGEIHYFRLNPEDWEDRLDKLKANGMDTVATYIPWVWHELPNGKIDVTGETHPQRNLVAFIDLCARKGLNVIARPGPFVMAEMKNEGIPYRLYKPDLGLHPTTWGGKRVSTRTLDYLAPAFLDATREWYAKVMPVLAPRLATRGGPIIAVQLDNEIGMLSWVSNSPDLTDVVCEDFRRWARTRCGDEVARQRIGADPKDAAGWAEGLRFPKNPSLSMHHDIGLYMRDRFRRYVLALREMAEASGVKDVPFLVNIHGTGGGRGKSFPIGISQLFETYRGQPGMTSSSDFYLGDLTTGNVVDLYLANVFMAAMHDADQPITSMEFEAGNGDYGDNLWNLYSPEGIELKTRLCIAQGNRLLNYYLHAGGENPPMESQGDGIDRVAFTGQRHGFAAPVGPDGELNPTYFTTGRVVQAMRRWEHVLADAEPQYDAFAIGFVPDHYMTEYRHPSCEARTKQIGDMEKFRGSGPSDMLSRMLILGGYSFPAVDLQAGVPNAACVVLGTGQTLGRQVQKNLVEFLARGGKLLIAGLLPNSDEDGEPCTLLADALGLKNGGVFWDHMGPDGPYWPCVRARDASRPQDARVSFAQVLERIGGEPVEALMTEVASGKPCATHVKAGNGEAVVVGCDYPSDLRLYAGFMTMLGVKRRWEVAANYPGLVVMSTANPRGQRVLQVLNLAPYAVTFTVKENGKAVFDGRTLALAARTGEIYPLSC